MTANERFKNSFSTWFWASMVVATVAHFAFLNFFPDLTAQDWATESQSIEAIPMMEEIPIPPPPDEIPKPAMPVASAVDIDPDITIGVTTFEDNPPSVLPEPPSEVTSTAISDTPTFTPYTVRPSVKNLREVEAALVREYPPLLRDAGIGGSAQVWFQIDEEGAILQTQVKTSSGHAALDAAALKVADVIQFTPALNRDKRVQVWISMAITFQTR